MRPASGLCRLAPTATIGYTLGMAVRWLSTLVIGIAAYAEPTKPAGTAWTSSICGTSLASRATAGGGCINCQGGKVVEPATGLCIAVGPPECQVESPSVADLDGSKCTPRWCPVRIDATGQTCQGTEPECTWHGDACDRATLVANSAPVVCPAGMLPRDLNDPPYLQARFRPG